MRRFSCLFAVLCVALLPACGTTPRTEIMVVVEADEGVQADAESLRFLVWGRSSDVDSFGLSTHDVLYPQSDLPLTFPRRFGVVPDGNDASRFIRVQVSAIDASGVEFVTQSAITGFAAGETRLLTLRLNADCRGVPCDEQTSTCKAGTCEDNTVEVMSLPPVLERDAGSLTDADMDGAELDGDVAMDAGVDSSLRDSGTTDSGADSGRDSGISDSGRDSSVDSGRDSGAMDSGTFPDASTGDSGGGPMDSGTFPDASTGDSGGAPPDSGVSPDAAFGGDGAV